jgi:hypothetical protein
VQVDVLIGSGGLLPLAPLVESLAALEQPVWPRFPSWLLLDPSDTAIRTGVAAGVALALLAALGVWPRLCLLLSAPLYLGYAVAAREFLSFQWDNLLIESLVLAALLPRRRTAPGPHCLLRLLLFKLYFESGLAKAQSVLGDWLDGSAMRFYYETAPLPAWPALFAHALPQGWHHLESWGALALETAGALLILGPRPARLAALAALTGFQLLNLATANYGFFVPLTLALHVFLLDDADLERLTARLRALVPARLRLTLLRVRGSLPSPSLRRLAAFAPPRRVASLAVGAAGALWLLASLVTAIAHFAPAGHVADGAENIARPFSVFRVANAYHLFGHITRERVEPEVQSLDGEEWRPHHLRYKPGDILSPPPFVAPHQPRVDFLLRFHGLDSRSGPPRYLVSLLARLCTEPATVASLFAAPLPRAPAAVRVAYWRYHFVTPEEREASGAWWRRELLGATPPLACAGARRAS